MTSSGRRDLGKAKAECQLPSVIMRLFIRWHWPIPWTGGSFSAESADDARSGGFALRCSPAALNHLNAAIGTDMHWNEVQ